MKHQERYLNEKEKAAFRIAFPRELTDCGWTCEQVARLVGVGEKAAANWLTGKKMPYRFNVTLLENAMGLHEGVLLGKLGAGGHAPNAKKSSPVEERHEPAVVRTQVAEHSTGFWWIDKWLITGEV